METNINRQTQEYFPPFTGLAIVREMKMYLASLTYIIYIQTL